MATDMHYDEMLEWIKQRQGLRFGQVASGFGIVLGLYLTLGSREPMHRLLFSAMTFGSAMTGRVLSGKDERISARLQDLDDISVDAWQDRLFRAFRPDNARLTVDAPSLELIPLFDWSALADADEHPVLGVVSPMGGGKTRLCKFLARHVLGVRHINVFDIYARVADWKGSTVLVEHDQMLEAMGIELSDIKEDVKLYRGGKSDFSGVLTVMEEGADTLLALKQANEDLTVAWLQKYTTVTRKIRRRLCVVSVKLNGVDFGTGAESRNDATLIFPGHRGVQKAMTDDRVLKLGAKQNADLRERLKASLTGVKRPALIYHAGVWQPASIPELNEQGDVVGMAIAQVEPAQIEAQSAAQTEPPATQTTFTAYMKNKADMVSKLEQLFTAEPTDEHPIEETNDALETLDPDVRRLAIYIQSKREIAVRAIKKTWGKNNNFTASQVDEFLIELVNAGLVETLTPEGEGGEWVKWAF